jgi:hypothetical protein
MVGAQSQRLTNEDSPFVLLRALFLRFFFSWRRSALDSGLEGVPMRCGEGFSHVCSGDDLVRKKGGSILA